MSNQSLKILTCYYKDILVETTNPIYFNIQCGKDSTTVDLNMTTDNTGDNISSRNRYWSEITGLYWAWKNIERSEFIGLCSYRRFFNFKKNPFKPVNIINKLLSDSVNNISIPNLDSLFNDYDIIIPKPYIYAYSIRRVCSMNYNDNDFSLLEEVIEKLSPDYIESYNTVIYKTNTAIGHNMFIMRWDNFQKYCEWVFPILFELEKKISPEKYPKHQVRVFGYMHELLLKVFIEKHKFRKFYSQIIWINHSINKFRFNSFFYRVAATFYYYSKKLTSTKYQHIVIKKT